MKKEKRNGANGAQTGGESEVKSTASKGYASPLNPPERPERPERADIPRAPRLIVEISRLLRARMMEGEEGVMRRGSARLVMNLLAFHGPMGQLDLVRATGLTPASISVLLRRMEEEGLLSRKVDERDRRAIQISLTEKGRAYDADTLWRLNNNDYLAIKGLSREEQEALETLLLAVRQNLLGEGEKET